MSDPFNISGRAFVVTGGAGYLGRHICAGLANARAQVLCLSSKPMTFSEMLQPCAGKVESVICDVSHEDEFELHLEKFGKRCGRLDGLVNNAMRAPRGIDLEIPKGEFDAAMRSILTQYFTCARIALRHLTAGGSVLNVASMWGVVSPDPAMYLDLKNEPCLAMPPAAAGILQMTKYMAVLAAPSGVRINALVPGCFPKKRGADRPDYMEEIAKRVPLGRIGQPQELVGAVIFLLSGAASYVTGHSLVVDGGYTLR